MKKLLTLILNLAIIVVNAQVTIDVCHEKAKANYPLILQYDLIDKSTEYNISNANKAWLPQVSLTGIGGYVIKGLPTFTTPGQTATEPDKVQLIGIAQLNQAIWDGGATKAQKNIVKASAEVEKSNIEVSIYSIRERVNQVFFGILLIDEQLNQLEILNRNLERNLKNITLSKVNGLAYQSDVDEVKAELLNLEQRKIEFTYTRKGYIQMLSLLTGQNFNGSETFETPLSVESIESMQVKRPELNLFTNQLKLNDTHAAINKALMMPKVGLMGVGIFMEPGVNFGSSKMTSLSIAGVSLSWKINGLYKNQNNKNIDKINTEKILNQQETFLFTNNLQLTQTASEIEKQKAIIKNDDEIVRLKSEITKSYQTRFDNDMCTMNDLINSMNRESEARASQALHSVQLLMSWYNYKTISGN